jgi:hypothetical protein
MIFFCQFVLHYSASNFIHTIVNFVRYFGNVFLHWNKILLSSFRIILMQKFKLAKKNHWSVQSLKFVHKGMLQMAWDLKERIKNIMFAWDRDIMY